MWLYSLMCVAPLATDCGYADRVLTPLIKSPTHEQCIRDATAFARKMQVSPKQWVIFCYEATEIDA